MSSSRWPTGPAPRQSRTVVRPGPGAVHSRGGPSPVVVPRPGDPVEDGTPGACVRATMSPPAPSHQEDDVGQPLAVVPPASTKPPASPSASRLAAPAWLNARSVAGLLLVLVSTVLGARALGAADDAQSVWVAARDLAPGSTLAAGDLEPGRVRLLEHGDRYLLAEGTAPLGYVLQGALTSGELVPRSVLVRPDDPAAPLRDVSVPVVPGHLPADLRAGQQVDVYVSTGAISGTTATPSAATPSTATPSAAKAPSAAPTASAAPATAAGPTRLVLQGVAVTARPTEGAVGARSSGVVLSVPAGDVATLVAAVQTGAIDLVRVPRPVG